MQFSKLRFQSYFLRLLIAVLFLYPFSEDNPCLAQNSNYNFEHLTTDHGLSSNKVEAILQDRDGFYWIATQNGLNRFDGTSFKIFRNNPNDSTSLTHNYCTNLLEDFNGDIWIATYKGISRYLKSKGIFQAIYLHEPEQNFEISNRLTNMVIDVEGNIWIAGFSLWKYDFKTDSLLVFSYDAMNPSSISDDGFLSHIAYDKINNGFWLAAGELNYFSIAEKRFYHRRHNPCGWKVFEKSHVEELALDHKNRLWVHDPMLYRLSYFDVEKNYLIHSDIRTKNGLKEIFVDPKDRIWLFYWSMPSEIFDPVSGITNTQFFKPLLRNSILNPKATFLYIDEQFNYWIASESGISIYNESRQYYKLRRLEVPGEDNVAHPLLISSVAQTGLQNLWLGTNQGLYNYNFDSDTFTEIIVTPSKSIYALCSDDQLLWIGLKDHIKCFDTKSGKIIKSIQLNSRIFFIRKGYYNDLWVGLWAGGLYRIDLKTDLITYFEKTGSPSNSIKSNSLITGLPDNDNFWIGYNVGQGFSKYSVSSGTFTHFHPHQDDLKNSNHGTITVIVKDHKDRMWLGSHGSGMFRFDPAIGTYENIQQQQGLNSNYINSIIPDEQDNLWISTADGVNFFNTETQSMLSLDINLVFPNNEFAANGIRGLNKRIYFYRVNDFVEIDPRAFKPATSSSKIVVSKFKIFDREVPVRGTLKSIYLTHRENFFTFEFSSIKTQPLKEVKYAYQLKGFDKDWNLALYKPTASYTNVPGGHYTFQVKATNDAGQWSDILLNVVVHIKPPFWRTWWFIASLVSMISAVVYTIYLYRLRQLKRIYSMKSKISQDLHDEVGSTLSSINVYSSIASKSLGNNMEITKKALNHINQNSRQVMDNMSDIVWAINSGNPGATTLEDKLKNYGYELLTPLNINVTYSIDDDAERKLSHMEARKHILLIAKEAMNNIARYSGATEALVHVGINNKHLQVKIRDNGKGFNMKNKRKGNGLFNIQHRTESMGGTFAITSEENGGTSLTCSIPITSISNT